jgi:hypothetical protein
LKQIIISISERLNSHTTIDQTFTQIKKLATRAGLSLALATGSLGAMAQTANPVKGHIGKK